MRTQSELYQDLEAFLDKIGIPPQRVIQVFRREYPNLNLETLKKLDDIYIIAARTGSVDAIKAVLEMYPNPEKHGVILVEVACSGSVEAIKYAMQLYPKWRQRTAKNGSNLMHWIATSASVEAFEFMLDNHPDFVIQSMLRQNFEYRTPMSIAHDSGMMPSFGAILVGKLVCATDALCKGEASPKQYELLNCYHVNWQWRLENSDCMRIDLAALPRVTVDPRLSDGNRKFLVGAKPILQLKAIVTEGMSLDLNLLNRLVEAAKTVVKGLKKPSLFSSKIRSSFVKVLEGTAKSASKTTHALSVADQQKIFDHIGEAKNYFSIYTQVVDTLVTRKLMATATLQQLQADAADEQQYGVMPPKAAV